jgi:hypothetical protein
MLLIEKSSDRIHAGFPQGIAQKIACLQTIDRIVKESDEGSIPPSTRPAGAPRSKESETPAAWP